MDLFVLLQVLRALEGFLADLADVWLEGCVDSEMTGDMVTLCTGCTAVLPLAGETEIVGALSADVVVAEMVVEGLGVDKGLSTILPETFVGRGRGWGGTSGGGGGRRRKSRRGHVGGLWQEGLGVHHVLKEQLLVPRW